MAPRNRQGGFEQGLYDPNDERDACGFGMIAQLDDQPSRALVDTAIAALSRMTHRGGVAADGLIEPAAPRGGPVSRRVLRPGCHAPPVPGRCG